MTVSSVHGHLGELGGALGGGLRQVGGGLLVDAQVVVVRLVPLVLVRLVPGRVRVWVWVRVRGEIWPKKEGVGER